jgi:hypothetical protein
MTVSPLPAFGGTPPYGGRNGAEVSSPEGGGGPKGRRGIS